MVEVLGNIKQVKQNGKNKLGNTPVSYAVQGYRKTIRALGNAAWLGVNKVIANVLNTLLNIGRIEDSQVFRILVDIKGGRFGAMEKTRILTLSWAI